MKKLLVALLMVATAVVNGTSFTHPLSFSAPGYDSVRCSVFVLDRSSGNYTAVTGQKYAVAAFPRDTTLALQNDSTYRIKYYWWAPGETDPALASEMIWPTRGDTGTGATGVWASASRTLSSLDEDVTTIDLNGTTIGTVTNVTNTVSADMVSISGDAATADSLERMLDGNRATLYLTQLDVDPTSGNKAGLKIRGRGTEEGIEVRGGNSGSNGVSIFAGMTASSPQYYGSGAALYLDSGLVGLDARGEMYGGYYYQTTPSYAVWTPISGLYVGSASRHAIRLSTTSGDLINIGGGIKDIVDSVLEGINDTARIGRVVWDSQIVAPANRDVNATATLSDADKKDIADSVWQRAFADADVVAGSIWDSLTHAGYVQGAASGLSAVEIKDTLIKYGFLTYSTGSDSILHLGGLRIIDKTDDDSATFMVYSTTDHATEFNAGGSNDAFRKITSSGKASYSYAGGTAGKAEVWAAAGNTGSYAWDVYAVGSGDAIRWCTGAANDTGDVWHITTGGNDTTIHNRAIAVEGQADLHGRDNRDEHAILVTAQNDANGLYILSDHGNAIRLSVTNPTDTSWALYAAAHVKIVDSLVVARINGVLDSLDQTISASVSIAGSGIYDATVFAVDTSAVPDDTVSGVSISARDQTGTQVGYVTTASPGYSIFNLDSGSYTFRARIYGGYVWNNAVCTVNAANDTFTLRGYAIAVDTTGLADKTCLVYCYVYNADGTPAKNVPVSAQLVNPYVRDSAGNAIRGGFQQDLTDANGRAEFTCLWSTYMIPATQWLFTPGLPQSGARAKQLTVPRQTSYHLEW